MFIIGEITVDDSIAGTKFACDLQLCKGACCTFPGGRGAPLTDNEAVILERIYPTVRPYLPAEHTAVIERTGIIEGDPGNYATPCVNGRACVFVYFDNDIAKCAIEKAFHDGKTEFQKPISCHLFPVRTRRNGTEIHYEYFSECDPSLERGRREDIPLHRFAAGPLARAFGTAWTDTLNETITNEQR